MWLPYKLSHLTTSCGAQNGTSKIENNKKQQPENTANNNQILAAVITHMQDARHAIHRVRIPYSKFSSPKTCRNVHESSLKINTIVLLLKWRQRAIDTHACVIVSRLYDVTNKQTKKTRAHFSRVSLVKLCESLYASLYRCLLHNIIFWQNFI